jgi:hypothetical protein
MCSAKTAPEHTEPTSNAYAFRAPINSCTRVAVAG